MEFTVDLSGAYSADEIHDVLEETLPLGEYYGRNLDALYDRLSEFPSGTRLLVTGISVPEAVMGKYIKNFRKLCARLNEERKTDWIVIEA